MKISNFNECEHLGGNNDVRLITFVNPYSYYLVDRHSLSGEFTYFADGIALVKLHNFFFDNKISRYSFDFTSLANIVFKHCADIGLKVAIVGGNKTENSKAVACIKGRFKNLDIVYCHDGYIVGDKWDKVIEGISESKADVVISGMGTPIQEEFLYSCKLSVPTMKLGFTCGGFLSQIASNPEYFSPFFDRLNLRWLQRFFRHSYVRKRVICDYPKFLLKYAFEALKVKL